VIRHQTSVTAGTVSFGLEGWCLSKKKPRVPTPSFSWKPPQLRAPYACVLCKCGSLEPLTPGPSLAMNPIAKITAAIVHPRLCSISGICGSLLGMSGPRSRVHIHASPDFPPNDAAAAETRTRRGPTGFKAPATQERTPAVK
jgi:hypothetical protein